MYICYECFAAFIENHGSIIGSHSIINTNIVTILLFDTSSAFYDKYHFHLKYLLS